MPTQSGGNRHRLAPRSPQIDLQAQDRAHRIGQKKPVTVLRPGGGTSFFFTTKPLGPRLASPNLQPKERPDPVTGCVRHRPPFVDMGGRGGVGGTQGTAGDRFVSEGSIEEKIYQRAVRKLFLDAQARAGPEWPGRSAPPPSLTHSLFLPLSFSPLFPLFSLTSPGPGTAAVIQQGRLQEQHKAAGREDLLAMVRWGAGRRGPNQRHGEWPRIQALASSHHLPLDTPTPGPPKAPGSRWC